MLEGAECLIEYGRALTNTEEPNEKAVAGALITLDTYLWIQAIGRMMSGG
jgi:hypothetical protein